MYHKSKLSNQLRVASKPMKDRDSVAFGIWIGSGGRHEEEQNKGAAHFLEHILFKGSEHYTCEEIKEKIEGVGGSLNAFTSEEQTCYFAKIPAKHLPRTFDILTDMVLKPLITEEDVEKERGVILEEIKMYHDLPQYYVLELLDELMWPNHPLGKNLAGTVESISAMRDDHLRSFHAKQYFTGNIVVAACGKLDHSVLLDLVKEKFNREVNKNSMEFLPAESLQTKPRMKLFKKDTEQMHVALGMYGLDYDHSDKYALALLNIVLGGNMSSRLFDELREKRGLAYSISSSAKYLKDTGLFLVRAGVDNRKMVDALDLILKELQKMKQASISADEFMRAKEYLLGQLLLGLEDTLDHMFWIGESMITCDRIRTVREVVQQVEKVTWQDIKRIAAQVIKRDQLNLSIVGPLTSEQEKKIGGLINAAY